MGTILASEIIAKAQTLLQDATGIRWPGSELLDWLNEGQREIVILKPDAYIVASSVQLIAGAKQSLPAACLILLDVVRNMGVNGNTPGRAIVAISKTVMDEMIPDWHTSTADGIVMYSVYDIRSPKTFYVYPPQPAISPQQVEISCSSLPANIASVGSAILLDDIYSGSLLDYCMYRAYSKDAEYAVDGGRAMAHYRKFAETLGAKIQVENDAENVTRVNR